MGISTYKFFAVHEDQFLFLGVCKCKSQKLHSSLGK